MSSRTKFLLGIGVIATLVIGWQVAAFAVHDTGAFELDGNATNAPAVSGDDWDNICFEFLGLPATNCSTTTGATGETAKSWVPEPNRNTTIFTGGGSKDPEDISAWAWKDGAGGLPDKDNLRHAFAARYDTAEGDVLYFGSDRFDNSGDAHQAFWFLQDDVTLGDVKTGGGFNFEGVHKNGDLLVISNFSNGGTTSTIFVYQWNDQVANNLELLASSTAANCANPNLDNPPDDPDNPGTNDEFCGIVNGSTITMPWSFTDKSNTPNNGALTGEFFEGGVNLSALDLDAECFSSALAETRSSTSTTATLKDFVLGSFDTCAPGMTTQASTAGPVTPGTAVTDSATITITGAESPADPTGDVTFFLCGPIATGDCSTGGTNIGTGTLQGGSNANDGTATATSPNVNTSGSVTGNLSPGRYCFRAEWPGDDNYEGTSHTNDTSECFTVSQPTSVDTVQRWIPQDTATVNPASVTGTVTFTLYSTTDCTGTPLDTFTDSSAPYATNNTTIIDDTTVSWRASFDATNAEDSTGVCETANVTFDNDGP